MNILIINWRDMKNPLYGGAEIHMEKIAQYLGMENNIYYLTSMYNGADERETIDNIHYIRIGNEYLFNFAVMMNIKGLLREIQPDIILEDINKVPFYTPLFTDIPVIAVIPHIFGKTIFRQTGLIPALYVYIMEMPLKHVYRRAYYEVISQSTKEDLIRRGIDGNRIKVIECGIDRDYEYLSKIEKFESPVMVYIGRLKKYKSIEHIIETMPRLKTVFPDIRLIIAGRGDYEENLKRRTRELNVGDYVEFRGYISEDEKWELLRRAWVSVYPSLIEGWGIVNIEANLVHTPVICADVPGLRDSVKNGYSGLLYEYGNTQHMAEQIITLFDEYNYKNYCRQAYEWSKHFNWQYTGKATEEFIQQTLENCPIIK